MKITTGSTLDTLRSDALALMPARHLDQDVAWIQITWGIQDGSYAGLSAEQVAEQATQELDAAAADYAKEC